MQKRFTVCALTMLSITCGAALPAQFDPGAEDSQGEPVNYVNNVVEK
jgi:hypothetical protein